ncbi:DNA-binding transcriptional regulator, LacI/PurR family [Amycolatopsis lurida]|uniref:LacI family transcriptional regulator n=1 Tax=Amycolatopsis lurida NRRL 2430 TaxID=1460371 RepID=A0A2P2FFX5_AMYLU|nr:LacI family DNA-binding transcriptional regulator [Amycolatopsis lurida]KFU75630.1 LacI family transcriptional regulator [Amycolatopsis lurida NRRL 2430]SEB33560.1 DNA-binding transcriptional regulator, LacI/PurR family [Amycolatopsis lurida]
MARETTESKQASLTDVAALAGVSHMTVSRVINGTGPVRAETRVRVNAAIEQLDYRPNSVARALVTGRSGTLGVVALEANLYGPASTLSGIEHAAREAGYATTITSISRPGRSSIADAVERLRRQAVEGIVVIAPHVTAARALEAAPSDVPLVAVGGGEKAPVPVITVDQYDGARRATEHLLGLGHETVWHVAGPEDWLEALDRERGWRETLQRHGARIPPVIRGDWSARSGYAAGRSLVGERGLGAVFVANDQMALGFLRACTEAGVNVPGEMRIVGFDDVPEAAYYTPPLTTVRQDFVEVGRRTFDLLRRRMNGGEERDRDLVVPELIVRESTGLS